MSREQRFRRDLPDGPGGPKVDGILLAACFALFTKEKRNQSTLAGLVSETQANQSRNYDSVALRSIRLELS
jgi:hypothetical protein